MSNKNLANSYVEALTKVKRASGNGMPLTIVGMYDSGKNFAFGNLNISHVVKKVKLIKIDLSGCFSETQKTLEAISLSFRVTGYKKRFVTFTDLKYFLTDLAKKQKVILALNIGFLEEVNPELVLALYNLRNLLGYRINWTVFANYGFLKSNNSDVQNIYEKIFFSEIHYIKPLNIKDTIIALGSMGFSNFNSNEIKDIYNFSGGNSGLIRALGLMITNKKDINNWPKDMNVLSRARKIISELDETDKNILLGKTENTDLKSILENVGFIDQKGKIFSPIVATLLNKLTNNRINLTDLTPTQEALWNLLSKTKGELITRDEIAQVLWGNIWREKYSDWTIDQAIYSLRQKLIELGISFKIKTKKGKGIVLEK